MLARPSSVARVTQFHFCNSLVIFNSIYRFYDLYKDTKPSPHIGSYYVLSATQGVERYFANIKDTTLLRALASSIRINYSEFALRYIY